MVNHNYLISPIFFSTEDKKSLARKAWFGLKEGKDLQLLPPQNIKFYKYIFFNIFLNIVFYKLILEAVTIFL